MAAPEARDTLDLTGVACPANAARALIRLEAMSPGAVLRLIVDDGEPLRNVPPALEAERHELIGKERRGAGWALLVRRGD